MLVRLVIYVLLAIAPLPFGSARPGWQWLWVLVIGLAGLWHVASSRMSPKPKLPHAVGLSLLMLGLFTVWGFLQTQALSGAGMALPTQPMDMLLSGLPSGLGNPHSTTATTVFFLSHLVFFYLVFSFCYRRDNAIRLIRFCGIVACLYAAYGFIVVIMGNETILWYEKSGHPNARTLTSTFVNRNNYAAFAGLGLQCLIACAYLILRRTSRDNLTGREYYLHLFETAIHKTWWLFLAILLTITALLLTESRGGFVSVTIAVLALIMLSSHQGKPAGGARSLIGYGLILTAPLVAFALSGDELVGRLMTSTGNNSRLDLYPLVLQAISDSPLLGTGLGTFSEVWPLYRDENIHLNFVRAHNDYLELLLTAGIPAAILLFASFAALISFLVPRLRCGTETRCIIALGITICLQVGLHSLVDFPLQIPAISYWVCAILAASVAVAAQQDRTKGQPVS